MLTRRCYARATFILATTFILCSLGKEVCPLMAVDHLCRTTFNISSEDIYICTGQKLITLPLEINFTVICVDFSQNMLGPTLQSTFENFHSLEILWLQNNSLVSLSSNLFKANTNLKFLFLGNNRLQSVPSDLFQNNAELIELDLSLNELQTLPTDLLMENRKLESLDLSHNAFKTLPPGLISKNPKLQFITCFWCFDCQCLHADIRTLIRQPLFNGSFYRLFDWKTTGCLDGRIIFRPVVYEYCAEFTYTKLVTFNSTEEYNAYEVPKHIECDCSRLEINSVAETTNNNIQVSGLSKPTYTLSTATLHIGKDNAKDVKVENPSLNGVILAVTTFVCGTVFCATSIGLLIHLIKTSNYSFNRISKGQTNEMHAWNIVEQFVQNANDLNFDTDLTTKKTQFTNIPPRDCRIYP